MISISRFIVLLAALACATRSTPASAQFFDPTGVAQSAPPGITVYGEGEVTARPNLVEIDLRASGSAELTADAIIKYQDSKRRTLEAFSALKMEGLKIEEGGLSIAGAMTPQQIQMIQNGMQGQSIKIPTQIGGMLRLKLSGVQDMEPLKLMETIGRLLDAAKDSGSGLGPTQQQINYGYDYNNPPALARFVLQDFKPQCELAYKKAVADARSRAERLAELNAVSLGSVLSVQEVELPGENAAAQFLQYQYGYAQQETMEPNTQPRIVSNQFTDIPIRVKLLVRFGIEPKLKPTAR
jgi:uncharacterized protein YggE